MSEATSLKVSIRKANQSVASRVSAVLRRLDLSASVDTRREAKSGFKLHYTHRDRGVWVFIEDPARTGMDRRQVSIEMEAALVESGFVVTRPGLDKNLLYLSLKDNFKRD